MRKSLLIFGLFLGLCLSAQTGVSAEPTKFTLKIYLSSGGENLNAFEGVLLYPKSWSIEEIELQRSKRIYWIESPDVENFGELSFSGIFPGGLKTLESSLENQALFSIEFIGDKSLEGLHFEDSQFYLNHPTALPGVDSTFGYTIENASFFQNLGTANVFTGINYSFEKDPVTQHETLVLDTYRSDLAAYNFFAKEGNFGTGSWSDIDGVQQLESMTQTVVLNVQSPQGEKYEMVLRRSFSDHFVWFLGWGGGGVLLMYLFFLVYKIFALKPEELTRG